MKCLFTISIILFSLASAASNKMDMACVTEFPSTSFVVREAADTVIVEIFNHNGPQYRPVYDGVVTPNDLGTIAKRANVVSKLPTILRFEWPRTKCEYHGPLVKSCMGTTDEQDVNGFKVSGWSFTSSEVTEKTFAGDFKSHKVAVHFSVDGSSYSVPMTYQEHDCEPNRYFRKNILQ
ncbi:hypothetical protein AZI85_05990 [Bdellovibrio bacteriovorus]|uniref:Uncharacterized protein n=1 Tax=Bdellovibrio bacteriovorus TaxID=959 RepID=A0A150WFL8_BDEBC|nr:hypothetical protein [Bdellovibrio bacteriovorus]KYG61770.1 hypothetical protein AZI85_05990 [Bdellovibrio bacteriovorus]